MGFSNDPSYDRCADIYDLKRKGAKDSLAHNKRLKEAVRKQLKHLIAEENIITSKGDKVIQIPIKSLHQPRFKFGKNKSGVGSGVGDGEEGDVIQQGQPSDDGDGQAGEGDGEDIYEVSVDLDEVVEMMMEDLALPFLNKKDLSYDDKIDYVFRDVRKKGTVIEWKRTIKQNLIKNAKLGNPHIGNWDNDDIRKRTWEEVRTPRSKSVVYLMMDNSGSMSSEKKYVVRSFFFWMVSFLKKKYVSTEVRFINHDYSAKFVEEKDFFTKVSSGGTKCSSAYELALDDINTNFNPDRYNVYVFHFSDGDNWGDDNLACSSLVNELVGKCSMVGYGEVRMGESYYTSSLVKEFSESVSADNFLSVQIAKKQDVYEALKAFLDR